MTWVCALCFGLERLGAQTFQTLVDWRQPWVFDQTGRDLGPDWVSSNYVPDFSWEGPGPGLFGYETDQGLFLNLERIHSSLKPPFSGGEITTYFRTTFNFTGDTAMLVVAATNLIDDGAVFYLNGTEVARFRVPLFQTASTLALDHEASGGAVDVFTITNLSLLRQGENSLAAELHQSSPTSPDVLFGTKLVAIRTVPLSITRDLQPQVVVSGDTLRLSIGLIGNPAVYRWYRNGTFVSGGTNAVFTVGVATTNVQGDYSVVVTNLFSAVTSRVARVTVLPDTVGPRVVEALGGTNSRGAPVVTLHFSEPLNGGLSLSPPDNLMLYSGASYGQPVLVTNRTYNFFAFPTVTLYPDDPGWKPLGDYFVHVRRVVDARGNWSAPDVRVPVRWTSVTNLVRMEDEWEFHDAAFFDPAVFTADPPWYDPGYSTAGNPWWGRGSGVFYVDYIPPAASCLSAPLRQPVSYQDEPTLFRRTFLVPDGISPVGSLQIRYIADDGMVLFLNGQEVWRYNTEPGPVAASSVATQAFNPVCATSVTISGTTLSPGLNHLAVAISQASSAQNGVDTTFGLELDYVSTWISTVPAEPLPGERRLAWSQGSGGGWLTWDTNFSGLELQRQLSYGAGAPWIGVSNQANPFLLPVPSPAAFYRLWKP